MRRPRSSEQELRLHLERCVKYRGTARIRLENLYFEWGEARELSRKNVERLKQVFRTENVHRLEPRNHIPAVVHEGDLVSAIQASKISAETLLSNPDGDLPMLKFPQHYKLTCLHGGHRIQAARETLPPTDAWWTVDLYLIDTNPELRATLVEEYSNEKKPSDGEIYRKIRQYEREGNVCFKRRWKARLSAHGRRSLQQLFNHGDGELTAAFDSLLDIPGLWDGMRISTLHKMIGMKCDEEVLHYLEHIKEVWHRLLRGDKGALQKVDQYTVKALELRAPRYSRRDSLLVQGQLLSGQIFGAFSRQEREAIWSNLRSIDGLIPSLFTFFEVDLKYLGDLADGMKQLVKLSRGDTVYTALQRKFPFIETAEEQYVIEAAESTFVVRSSAIADRFDLCYRQLWLYTMRHYTEMPTETSKNGKDLLAKAGVEKADEVVLSEFVALAQRLGFESREIQSLRQRSADWQIARNALLKARKPDRYRYDEAALEAHVAQIVELFTTATPLPLESLNPTFVSADPDAPGNRCGFPDKDAQDQDRKFLFLPYLHNESEERGQEVTSFFVRRSVYLAFFGKPLDVAMDVIFDEPPPTSPAPYQTAMSASQVSQINGVAWPSQQRFETGEVERNETRRQEQQRLEQERLEQERLEQERHEQERHEQQRLEQQRLEQQRLEQERQEQERQEQERQEQERQEQERYEQAKPGLESLGQETTGSRGDSEQAPNLPKQLNLESDANYRPREDQRPSPSQEVRHSQVHLQQVTERAANSNLGLTQKNNESVVIGDGGNAASSPHTPTNNYSAGLQDSVAIAPHTREVIRITYMVRERGGWRAAHMLEVDPSDTSEVERVAVKYMRKQIRLFDTNLNILTPRNCFEAATADGQDTILLIPEADINISKELEASVTDLTSNEGPTAETGTKKRNRR